MLESSSFCCQTWEIAVDELQSCARMRILPLAVADAALAQHQLARPTAIDTPLDELAAWAAKCELLRDQVKCELMHYAHILCPMCVGYGTLPLFLGQHDPCRECRGTGSRTANVR